MAVRKPTKAEREQEYQRVMANASRTRDLAEKGLAQLEGRAPRKLEFDFSTREGRDAYGRFVDENVARTRALARNGQAELAQRRPRNA